MVRLWDGFKPFTFTVTSTSTFTMVADDRFTAAVRGCNRRGARRSSRFRSPVLVRVNVNMHVNECDMRLPWSQYPARLWRGRYPRAWRALS
jgi:hypothetical protein